MYKKENHNNFTDAQYYNLLFLAPSNEWCTIFSDLLFLTVEWRFLVSPCQEKKRKECGGGFLKISSMNDETPVSPSLSMTVTKAEIRQAHICILLPDIDKLCPPLLFSFSLSNYWTLGRWTKAVHKGYTAKKKKEKKKKKKKKLFTIKTNKNQYIKTIFLARQKAYKKKLIKL